MGRYLGRETIARHDIVTHVCDNCVSQICQSSRKE